MHKLQPVLLLLGGFATAQAGFFYQGSDSNPLIPQYTNMVCLSTIILVGCMVRAVIVRYNIPTPIAAFMAVLGFGWGALAYKYDFIREMSAFIYMNPQDILFVYTPILLFSVAFTVDSGILEKILPQVVVMGIFVTLLTGVVFGSLMRLIIGHGWSVNGGFVFGIYCSPVDPTSVVYLLKNQSQTKQTSVLLQAEALLGLLIVDTMHSLLVHSMMGFLVSWYHFVAVILRILILGIVFGYVMGLFARYLLRKMYTNRMSVFVVCFVLPFFTFAFSKKYFAGTGSVAVAVVGLMMSTERTALARDIDVFLYDLWTMISFIMEVILCVSCAIQLVVDFAWAFGWSDYILLVITFVLYYVVRFSCFLLFSPLISRLGYGMDLKNLIICVWSGIKCPFSVVLVRVFVDFGLHKQRIQVFFFHTMGLYVLSMLVNGTFTRTIMDFLNLRTISLARQLNMNNCIRHIFTKRERTIAILKMDRFLVDTDWPMVIEATNMKHPYHIDLQNDEDLQSFGQRFADCPDCHKEIQQEPTAREFKEMTREANLRILKAKKMSYSRQFANGMMSKEAIRILTQAVDLAADSSKAVIELEGLERRFRQEGCVTRCIRNRTHQLNTSKVATFRRPRSSFRRFCYRVVVNNTWEKAMCYVILANLIVVLSDIIYSGTKQAKDARVAYVFFAFELIFCFVYILEFYMKVLAYSWLYIWKHGVRTYLKSFWNVLDFVVIIAYLTHICNGFKELEPIIVAPGESPFEFVLCLLMFLRYVRLVRLFELFYPKIIRYLDKNLDTKVAFTYELGKSYTVGETEVLDLLPYMIDNKRIREQIKQKIERDRVIITKLLGVVQKEKPWVAITVKTKQAIRTILKSMTEAQNQLRISGWVDDYEQEKLEVEMGQLYKKVNGIRTVQPSPPKVIFREVSWMVDDQDVIDFLFENVTVKTFEAGDKAFEEGTVADGVYIVVTGLFMIKYQPQKSVLESLREYGTLPVVDYLSSTKFEESSLDYIVSGNCIGELSTLTRRPYNCTITADAHSQVYVLSYNVLRRAMELSPDPVTGLECRIWKEVGIRIAVQLLMSVPAYQNFSQDQIKYTLERAFVPNLSNYKIFAVTEMIQDIILIEGVASDFNTRDTFVAPCCIPRRVQKLILPTSSLVNIPINLETRLLIIPEKDLDEYDVMHTAEETGEMVAVGSATKCLHHAVKERARQRKRIKLAATGAVKRKKRNAAEPMADSGLVFYKSEFPESVSAVMQQRRKASTEDETKV